MVFGTVYDDVWLRGGVRTGFADYAGVLAQISPTDLGIAAGRAALERTRTAAASIDTVIAANVAQSSFDALFLARHIGHYCGVPIDRPALLVQRLCTSGFEAILQAADAIKLGKAATALCVGAESMSRNPVAAYTQRTGFRMGQVEFRDFLWEATLDTAPMKRMGDTAEMLAVQYQVTREAADDFAAESFARALAARQRGFFAEEIVALKNERFARDGYADRGIALPR
ncbi:MAG TPA: acetyl-CoA C-acyltransferase, partial [Stellaceae bacterium]|nr:acetyl-CoA C-acyltransferase [Stellaceae bacterium]